MPDLCLLIFYNPNPNKVLGSSKSDCFFWRFRTWICSGAWIHEFLQLLLLRFFEEEGTCKLFRRHSTHWQALKVFDPGTTPFVMSLDVLNVLVLLLGGFLNALEFALGWALRCVLYISVETMPKPLSVLRFFTVLWYDHIPSCHVLFCFGQNWHNV